jgi:hypothetical protein
LASLRTVDSLGVADDKVACTAAGAFEAVAAMPAAANALAELPLFLARRDRNDDTDNLMAGDAWVLHAKQPEPGDIVAKRSR